MSFRSRAYAEEMQSTSGFVLGGSGIAVLNAFQRALMIIIIFLIDNCSWSLIYDVFTRMYVVF